MANEGIVDGWEKGGDDHRGNAGIVDAPEEEVEPPGMAGQKVAQGTASKAHHGTYQEHHYWPP